LPQATPQAPTPQVAAGGRCGEPDPPDGVAVVQPGDTSAIATNLGYSEEVAAIEGVRGKVHPTCKDVVV